ncbi:MAG: recombinase family protein [Ruminococcus sp.]
MDPAQADIVSEVFERAVNGESFTAIAKDLNSRSITRCLGGK